MKRGFFIYPLALCLAGGLAPNAYAQSDADDASMSVNLLPSTVSVVNTAALDFGDVLPGASSFVVSSDIPTAAAWTVDVAGALRPSPTTSIRPEHSSR